MSTPLPETHVPERDGRNWTAARTWRRVVVLASAATYLWVLFLLAMWVLGPMVGFRWQPVMIDAGSMLPVIQPGDVVLVDTDVDVATLDRGTIITFDDPVWPDMLVTHRIVERLDDGSFRTRGDGSGVADSTAIQADTVMGAGRLLVPYIGLPMLWLRDAPATAAVWALLTITAWVVVARIRDLVDPNAPTERARTTRRPAGRLSRVLGGPAPVAGPVRRWGPTTLAAVTAGLVVTELGIVSGLWPLLILLIDPRGPQLRLGRWRRSWTEGRLTRRLKPAPFSGTLTSIAMVVVTLASTATFVAATANPSNSFAAAVLAPPTGLTATQSCSGTTPTVTLDWTATTSPQAQGYALQRTSSPPRRIDPASTETFADTTVSNNTAYTWDLRAYNGTWRSAPATVDLTTSCSAPAPTFVTNTSFQALGSSATHTVPGSVQAGDLLVVFTGTGSSTVNAPAGWSLLRADDEPVEGAYTRVFWRIATAGDPGTGYTFTSGGSTYSGASVMLAFRGVDQAQPFDSHTGVTYIKQDVLTAPSITTSVANTRLLTLHFHEEGTDRGNTITPDAAMTEIYEDWSLSRTIEVAQQSIAGTGATGTRTATASVNDDGIMVMLAIRPTQ
ncbi:signal peptidase I [Euzebya pacifica]|jgi:signal peptidase|uniref:signal peptidase I n=1 Tax=Euzebya pacifica TaxID=1608957 RepID=UPI0030F91EFC